MCCWDMFTGGPLTNKDFKCSTHRQDALGTLNYGKLGKTEFGATESCHIVASARKLRLSKVSGSKLLLGFRCVFGYKRRLYLPLRKYTGTGLLN